MNLAGRQFTEPDLVEQIAAVLAETGLDTASLKLEVTETVLMEHVDAATVVLEKLNTMGIRLLMDDFGTGYSSLSYLHRKPAGAAPPATTPSRNPARRGRQPAARRC